MRSVIIAVAFDAERRSQTTRSASVIAFPRRSCGAARTAVPKTAAERKRAQREGRPKGTCMTCCILPARPGRTTCAECAADNTEIQRDLRAKTKKGQRSA